MYPLSSRSAWSTIAVLALLPVASVYAHPIQESATATQVQPATNIQPRAPRLIPDTEHYLAEIFDMLGVQDPNTSSETPTSTPTQAPSIHITVEQDKPVNATATVTPISSASMTMTMTSQPAMYTPNIRHGDTRPIENIQIGSGWTKGSKLQASDLPIIFDALGKELDHQFRNMIDSSDERGLGDDADSNRRVLESVPNSDDFAAELGFLG